MFFASTVFAAIAHLQSACEQYRNAVVASAPQVWGGRPRPPGSNPAAQPLPVKEKRRPRLQVERLLLRHHVRVVDHRHPERREGSASVSVSASSTNRRRRVASAHRSDERWPEPFRTANPKPQPYWYRKNAGRASRSSSCCSVITSGSSSTVILSEAKDLRRSAPLPHQPTVDGESQARIVRTSGGPRLSEPTTRTTTYW